MQASHYRGMCCDWSDWVNIDQSVVTFNMDAQELSPFPGARQAQPSIFAAAESQNGITQHVSGASPAKPGSSEATALATGLAEERDSRRTGLDTFLPGF